MLVLFIVLVVMAVISGGFCYWLANEKGRDPLLWMTLGILFGPLALLTLGLSPETPWKSAANAQLVQDQLRKSQRRERMYADIERQRKEEQRVEKSVSKQPPKELPKIEP